ncbi:Crp/Fnr family transcriptional regulator [Bradyrhizobium ottawaense]
MVLQEPKRHAEHVYFVESGLVSLRVVAAGSVLETAVIGYRGVVGASFLCGGHLSTHQSVVLFPGSAHRIRVEELRRLVEERPEIREHLFEYVQALTFQCVQTGLCGVRHDREQRLASWLCLASDAADVCVLPVTHDYLSSVLGLRRAGVTQTLSRFEERGLIRKMRGVLEIDEPKCLEKRACCCYKLISGAYASSQSRDSSKRADGVTTSHRLHLSSSYRDDLPNTVLLRGAKSRTAFALDSYSNKASLRMEVLTSMAPESPGKCTVARIAGGEELFQSCAGP